MFHGRHFGNELSILKGRLCLSRKCNGGSSRSRPPRYIACRLSCLSGMVISSKEKQLIKQLLNTYDTVGRLGRPVNDSEDKLVVEYGLTLVQILDLDERNQVLTTNVWGTYVRIH